MLAITFRLLIFGMSLLLAGCCQIFSNVFPACWPFPGVVSAPCLPKSAFQHFPGPIELPHHIVLIVPLTGPFAWQGWAVWHGFKEAYRSAGFLCRPERIDVMDSTCGDCIQEVYYKAICRDADFIVGPLTPCEVQDLVTTPLQLPTITLGYLDPDQGAPTNVYQFGPDFCQRCPSRAYYFALGYDAYKLAIALNGLTLQTSICGATGILHLNDRNQIVRSCNCPRTLFPEVQNVMNYTFKYNPADALNGKNSVGR